MAVSPKNLCEIHKLGAQTREWLVTARQVPAFHGTRMIVAGHTEAQRGYRFVRHAPKFGQILACIEGEGEVALNGKWVPCGPGTAYVTPARTPCAYRTGRGGSWRLAWALYEEDAGISGLKHGEPLRLLSADAKGLLLAVEGLCHAAGEETDPGALAPWAQLVHRACTRLFTAGEEVEDYSYRRLWAAVRGDLAGDWDLGKMARVAGMSEESLRRRCLAHLGKPPMASLTRLRLQYAADLLASNQDKIAAVAGRAGYGDAFAFSNAFRREFGVSPKGYRTRLRSGPKR